MVFHISNPSSIGGIGRRISFQVQHLQKHVQDPTEK
jgi:hypothetical protein